MTNKKRVPILFAVLTLFLPIFGIIFAPKVQAAETGTVVDRSTIRIGEVVFFDSDLDSTFEYREQDPSDGCADKINGFNNSDFEPGKTPSSATLVTSSKRTGSTSCTTENDTVTFSSGTRDNFLVSFAWQNGNITTSDGKTTFESDGSSNVFQTNSQTSGGSCLDTITVSADGKTARLVVRSSIENSLGGASGQGHYDWHPFRPADQDLSYNDSIKCWETESIRVRVAGTKEAGHTGGASTQHGSGSAAEAEPSCESGGGEWSWLLCPALRVASDFVLFVDEQLNKLLTLPSEYYEDPQVELAWSRMRNLAYAVLIPIMLIMIIATALGYDFISAYTFKKAMPRLVVAILFIALSLEITQFLVILTNEVGQGILGLITSAFNGAEEITLASLFDPGGVISGIFTGALFVGGILALGAIPLLLLFLLTAGLSLGIAFLALAFRQMLLIAFMIIAPLAILAWIFPGNDKLWKLWWNAFSKLLLLYPLIMFLIGAGRAFAALVQSVQETTTSPADDDFLYTILKLAAYILPFFFIPAMFKFAGGIFATITGMTNDRSKGVFDRLRNARSNQGKKIMHRAQNDKFFKGAGEKGFRAAVNKSLMGATLLPESGLRPKQMGTLMQQAKHRKEMEEAAEIRKGAEGGMFDDDDFDEALMEAGDDEAAFKRILSERAEARYGEVNQDAINGAVAARRRLRRKYSQGALSKAAFMGGSGSSTMWNNDMVYETEDDGKGGTRFKRDDKGNKIVAKWTQAEADAGKCKQAMVGTDKVASYNASGKMLRHINMIAGSDRMLSTQLLAMARANQSRAGREDTGGGGFSDTAMEMDALWRAQNGGQEYSLEEATKGVTKSLIKGKNVYEIFRSGKPRVAQAVAPVLAEMTEEELQGAVNSVSTVQTEVQTELATIEADYNDTLRTIQETPNISEDERRSRTIRLTEEIGARTAPVQARLQAAEQRQVEVALRAIAREQMFHSVAATSSPDVAQTMGNQLFNTQFNMDLLPEQIRQHVIQKSGKATPTHLEVFESLRDHPVWGAYVKEYGRGPIPRLDPNDPNVQAEAARVGMQVNAYVEQAFRAAQEDAARRSGVEDPNNRP